MKRLLIYCLLCWGIASSEGATFTVFSTLDSGPGTFRQAILDANATPGAPHQIAFAITTTTRIISPYTALPAITNTVFVDGFTQVGSSPNTLTAGTDARFLVQLSGSAMPATSDLLRFECDSNMVRGLILTNYRASAIRLTNSNHNVIVGNQIIGGSGEGIAIGNGSDNRIGGPTPGERNTISRTSGNGISIIGSSSINNRVINCYLGLNAAGGREVGSSNGVFVVDAANNLIGPGNFIADNGRGVQISGVGASNNVVLGNTIGLDVIGNAAGNSYQGILISSGASLNRVGGTNSGEGNRISQNRYSGVYVQSGTNNAIRGNSIYLNGLVGIALETELDPSNVNDQGDSDTGANQKQNFPVITSVTIASGSTRVKGTLNSLPLRDYSLDFFASTTPEDWVWPFWEGQYYLGTATTTTGEDGNGAFDITLPIEATARWITATATSPEGDTSEFSDAIAAGSVLPTNTYSVTNTNDSGVGSLRDVLTANNISTNWMPNRIEFHIPGPGPFVVNVLSPLPAITQPAIIDGYSQAGAKENTLTDGDDRVIQVRLNAVFGASTNGTPTPFLNLASAGCVVRGLEFTGTGIYCVDIGGPGNCVVEGCFFGAVADVTSNNFAWGVGINIGHPVYSGNNLIGGSTPGARNVMGLFNVGVQANGINNRIIGNFIGTDPSGTIAKPNEYGVAGLQGRAIVGGLTAAERNVISGNTEAGILAGSIDRILGNFIGTDVTGRRALGNRGHGVIADGGARQVGGVRPGEANIIAYNGRAGIFVSGGSQQTLRGNRIFNNVGLGIDLGSIQGVTLNDDKDADKGPNDFQNFPVLTAVAADGASLRIQGSLNSLPNSDFTIDFYSNRTADASGYGQGEQYIGAASVTTDTNGNSGFLAIFPAPVGLGRYITATATDAAGSTSEFSAIAKLPDADTDGDGLDDNWERQYFGDLSHDGSADSDLDGMGDRDELTAGTDPTDSNSSLRFVANPIRTSTTATLKFKSVPGKRYRVQFKESLNAPAWSDVPGEIAANGPTISLTDIPLEIVSRFYRVMVVQ